MSSYSGSLTFLNKMLPLIGCVFLSECTKGGLTFNNGESFCSYLLRLGSAKGILEVRNRREGAEDAKLGLGTGLST